MTIIDDLRIQKQKLTEQLNACTDEKAYDLFDEELRSISKTLTLAENRERARIAAETEARRKAELDAFNAEKNRLLKAKADADKQDVDLFEMIRKLHKAHSDLYDAKEKIATDTEALKLRAQAIGQEEPQSVPVSICNFSDTTKGKGDGFIALLKQFDQAASALQGAHRRGEKGLPTNVEMSWYYRGHGEFYPRDYKEPEWKEVLTAHLKANAENQAPAQQG